MLSVLLTLVFLLCVTDARVNHIPTTPHIEANTSAVLNKPFSLRCISNSTTVPSGHNFNMTYKWTKNTRPLKKTSKVDFDGPSLLIKNFTWKKRQIFRCTSTENDIRSDESLPVTVSPQWAPTDSTILPSAPSIVEEEGTFLNLTCSADCQPLCSQTWKRGQQTLSSTKGQYIIESLIRGDQDTYTCVISNILGTKERNVSVRVEYGPSDLSLTPITGTTQHSVISEGSSFGLQCRADCRPRCKVTLTKLGSSLRYNGTLSIQHVQRNDTGTFICNASNRLNQQKSTYNLTVSYPATVTSLEITYPVKRTSIDQGSDVTLICTVDSVFPASITWKREDKVIKTIPTNKLKETRVPSVELKNVNCTDMVPYQCLAKNEYGRTSKNITLNINCAPSSTIAYSTETFTAHIKSSGRFDFDITANPEPKFFNWSHVCGNETVSVHRRTEHKVEHVSGPFYKLKVIHLDIKERDAGKYTITLENSMGKYQIDYTIVVQVLPSAPTNLTVENVTENSVILQFIRGFDGRAMQHFEAEMTKFRNQPILISNLTVECEDSVCVTEIIGMESDSLYGIKLRAANEVGKSDFTPIVDAKTSAAKVGRRSGFLKAMRLVLVIVGVIVCCVILAGLIYILTCRPCHRKRRKAMRKLEADPTETEETEEAEMDLWESVAADQNMVVYGGDASMGAERRVSECKYTKMRVESLTLTTFAEDEQEPRYINFRWENDRESQSRGIRYLCDLDTTDNGY